MPDKKTSVGPLPPQSTTSRRTPSATATEEGNGDASDWDAPPPVVAAESVTLATISKEQARPTTARHHTSMGCPPLRSVTLVVLSASRSGRDSGGWVAMR